VKSSRTPQPLWMEAELSFEVSVSVKSAVPHSTQKDQNSRNQNCGNVTAHNLTFIFHIPCAAPTILSTVLFSRHLVLRYFIEYSTTVEWESGRLVEMFSARQVFLSIRVLYLLKTKHILIYVRNQSVPHSKHFPPRL